MNNKWFSFFIGNERYCANISDIKEVLPYREANPFPGSDENTEGILSIRGEILTILNGDQIFSCENITPKNNIIIIEDESENRLGITIDNIDEIIEFELKQIESSDNQSNDLVLGTVNTHGHLFVVLNFKALIAIQQGLNSKVSTDEN
ncbi:chemotaxis protein CheW [Catenovulum sp. 2E275]|uniref:chemotaxis protein CheW n=1 Tax=Catenovulum sp. 2E275 TaxID=2980497 RepID=UPI0021D203A7|nr:chemotaxis protein CheW [Catenovulum sp. 2E275]MCU4674408.1 chemotaxis protein CheW [Catenovulum sp. 2E275]